MLRRVVCDPHVLALDVTSFGQPLAEYSHTPAPGAENQRQDSRLPALPVAARCSGRQCRSALRNDGDDTSPHRQGCTNS